MSDNRPLIEFIDCAMWTAKEAQNILNALDAGADNEISGLEQSRFYITDFSINLEKNSCQTAWK
ncbi:MAG: hypothetical protein PVI26_10820 [Chitinispirillia bacterium]|jgi:hypothetical protein